LDLSEVPQTVLQLKSYYNDALIYFDLFIFKSMHILSKNNSTKDGIMKKILRICVLVAATAVVAGCGFGNCGYSSCTSCSGYLNTGSCCGSNGWY
jgi:hypothetical protein